ncbi:hypothetical protein VFPFJ_08251 [Purpureocillium lilacinum]|uniref:Uncharacterized protein n=1 Tax=Purpureocillium lilacinum TaxID=33203 RepID=A0A179H7H0_PURLI|nr:hypothetical protein VFPFJ_08251 [Purpureocillium lilacinum]OAQ85862.1 hypothetical protein VFPFJ_08251 [Purpureocillium lilacinum]
MGLLSNDTTGPRCSQPHAVPPNTQSATKRHEGGQASRHVSLREASSAGKTPMNRYVTSTETASPNWDPARPTAKFGGVIGAAPGELGRPTSKRRRAARLL